MKKTILFAALILCCAKITKAQNFTNNTSCDVTIEAVCYDVTCAITPCTGSLVNVAAGATKPIPTSCCNNTPSSQLAYRVCYTNTCPGTCVIIKDYFTGGGCYPAAAAGGCPQCNNNTPYPLLWVPPTFVDIKLN